MFSLPAHRTQCESSLPASASCVQLGGDGCCRCAPCRTSRRQAAAFFRMPCPLLRHTCTFYVRIQQHSMHWRLQSCSDIHLHLVPLLATRSSWGQLPRHAPPSSEGKPSRPCAARWRLACQSSDFGPAGTVRRTRIASRASEPANGPILAQTPKVPSRLSVRGRKRACSVAI